MWWLLAALVLAILWVLELALEWPLWVPISLTAAVLVGGGLVEVWRRFSGRRAALNLERALGKQVSEQLKHLRPDRRPEVEELHKQIRNGIEALKKSKLGGGKGGSSALYALPWYVIIGPPGAGKTTALKHSGLVFPYASAGGGSVRGVGGTRSCDWWFTNEAILLDTAGRYATESNDQGEWIEFLRMLRRYRSKRPINGILLAISATDLLQASETSLQSMAARLRARMDEIVRELGMVFPVYLVVTKVDLVAGFRQFFSDFKKSDRAQGWGATLPLNDSMPDPGALFETEFDALVGQVHARGLRRLATERDKNAKERIYQFPLEFAALGPPLKELIGQVFAVNAFQMSAVLRGFYFTSGTQEGKPLARVMGQMGKAMGIAVADAASQGAQESKSYFLHDVFRGVVFPDQDIAVRSPREIRRQWLLRGAVTVAAIGLGIAISAPGASSFAANRAMLRAASAEAQGMSEIVWDGPAPVSQSMAKLDPVLTRLEELERQRLEGVPLSLGWGMYTGEQLEPVLMGAYATRLYRDGIAPSIERVARQLRQVTGDRYLAERDLLKLYLMLGDPAHLDPAWASGPLTQAWFERLAPVSDLPEMELRARLRRHVSAWLSWIADGRIAPLAISQDVVDVARRVLLATPVEKRFYDFLVSSVAEEVYNDDAEAAGANRRYPPITLAGLFGDRPDVLKVVESERFRREKKYALVEGPYTERGHFAVLQNIEEAKALLEREAWVVPLTQDDAPERLPGHLRRVADRYERVYVEQWTAFLEDVRPISPRSLRQAVEIYDVLTRPEWPFLRLLRTVEDHTQWRRPRSALENESVARQINQRINYRVSSRMQGLRFDLDVRKIGGRVSIIPTVFQRLVEFGAPGAAAQPGADTALAKYMSMLTLLKEQVQRSLDEGADPTVIRQRLDDARRSAEALVQPLDDKARSLLLPILVRPLTIEELEVVDADSVVRPTKAAPPKFKIPPGFLRRPKL